MSRQLSPRPSESPSGESSRLLLAVVAIGVSGCTLSPLPAGQERGCGAWEVARNGVCAKREWQLPQAEDGLGSGDVRGVSVAMGEDGTPLGGWVETIDAKGRMAVAEWAEYEVSVHYPGAALGGSTVQGDIAVGDGGEAVVAWKNQFSGETARVFVSERGPDGWTDPEAEEDAFSFLPTAYEPRPLFFPNGDRLLVWNQWMSTGYGVAVAQKKQGASWEMPANADDVLSVHYLFSNAPTPALNERGDVLISWYQSGGASLLAWKSERFGYDGELSTPGPGDYLSVPETPIDSHPTANPKPALAPDGRGAIVWTQENGKGSVLVYIATRTSDGAWTKPQNVDDTLSPRLGYARCPQVAFGPEGDLFVVWYQDTGSGNRVVAAHRDSQGQWIEPGREPTLLSSEGVEAVYPALAIGKKGAVLAVWSERREEGWVIAGRRRGSEGTAWGEIEVLSPPNGGTASLPDAAIGGENELAIAGWSQGNGKDSLAYFAVVGPE